MSAATVGKQGHALPGRPIGGNAHVDRIDEQILLDESVGARLGRLAAEAGDRSAVMWSTDRGVADSLTYARLHHDALQVAAGLLDLNPSRSRVALAALNSVDWIVAMYGCALAGMPVVPVSASATIAELEYQLEHAAVGVALTARTMGAHAVLDDVAALAVRLTRPVVVREIGTVRASAAASLPELDGDSEFLVQFTSGTTGLPKAASISHRAALNAGLMFGRVWSGDADTRFLNPLPLHHVGGSVAGLITTLAIGGTYTLVERFSPRAVLDALRQVAPTVAGLVPTMMIDILGLPGVSPADFTSLRAVVGGATAVDPALVTQMEERLGVRVIGSYGQSEAPAVLATAPEDPVDARIATIGRCLPGRAIAIRDRSGNVVPVGADGELCVRGPLTMSGYLRADGSLDAAADSDGWRGTGDVCAMDDDGLVTFRGRMRDVIIRGGLNVYPAEIEQALSHHESVSEVAVFGIPDIRFGESVVAAVLPRHGTVVDVAALQSIAAEKLSSYKRPTEWVVVSELPRTSTGKVRKHLLGEWYGNGMLGASGTTSPVM